VVARRVRRASSVSSGARVTLRRGLALWGDRANHQEQYQGAATPQGHSSVI